MYNHGNQYRCTIIRGKSQKEIDNMLPAYAQIISNIAPCTKDKFEDEFNKAILQYIPATSTPKTINNHRTEIAGTLFGMYYEGFHTDDSEELYVYPSERTLKFLEDNDQPAFFKDVCYKMQFPNGMTKSDKVLERIEKGISIRPNSYLLKILSLLKDENIVLTKREIGYYVLNSLDVLTREAKPDEVIEQIKVDKKYGLSREIKTPSKATSYDYQHITEQINYLELANLLITNSDGEVRLNPKEDVAIELFSSKWDNHPDFTCSTFDLSTVKGKKKFQMEWDYFFSQLSPVSEKFTTTAEALNIETEHIVPKQATVGSKTDLGDEGELYVLNYEKNRVKEYDARLARKVIHLGKQRGLGYDIQSVVAEDGDFAEFVKYIEVKATKRVTEPDLTDSCWSDTINITRNEWIAAMQHKDSYSIFRVYFVRGSVIMYVIKNIHQKEQDKIIKVVPTTYRVDFCGSAIDEIIPNRLNVGE